MASYTAETLIEGEKVTYEAKLHWIIFIGCYLEPMNEQSSRP